MSFPTNWEPEDVIGEIEKIAAKRGGAMYNIHQHVGESIPDGRGGYYLVAESTKGIRHVTGGKYHVQKDPVKGSRVSYIPDWKTSSAEARNIEEDTKKFYFNGDY